MVFSPPDAATPVIFYCFSIDFKSILQYRGYPQYYNLVVFVWISIDFISILKDFNAFFEHRLIFAWFLLNILDVQAFSLGTGVKV